MNHSHHPLQHGPYRPHIDGIRALAVIPVVLFHLMNGLCPGGYVGVDVFFVISGYLIVSGILRDCHHERFSIAAFYHRRLRRIMPAYLVMVAGVLGFGVMMYYAYPLMMLGDTVVAASTFLANIHFWSLVGGDYFSPQLHSQPLLHLWSLSVEEQFYLMAPLLCYGVYRCCRKWLMPIMVVLAVASLVISVMYVRANLASMAFYMPHCRAWELLAGALLAWYKNVSWDHMAPWRHWGESHKPWQMWVINLLHSQAIAMGGVLLVVGSYLMLTANSKFPGLTALPAVLGTVALLHAGQRGWVGRWLSSKMMVGIGKISYSLYLWHWPVMVYWRYLTYDQLNIADYVGMITLSFLLAVASWRYVESPVRMSQYFTLRRCLVYTAVATCGLIWIGTLAVERRGWIDCLHPQANQYVSFAPKTPFIEARIRSGVRIIGKLVGKNWLSDSVPPRNHAAAFEYGNDGTYLMGVADAVPSVLLVGDSHAGALQYGIHHELLEKGVGGIAFSKRSGRIFDASTVEYVEFFALLDQHPSITHVILAEYWLLHMNDSSDGWSQLQSFMERLRKAGKKLLVVSDLPVWESPPGDILARRQVIEPRRQLPEWDGFQSAGVFRKRQGDIMDRLQTICLANHVIYTQIDQALAVGSQYKAFEPQGNRRIPLYRDFDHLSPAGSLMVAPLVSRDLFRD